MNKKFTKITLALISCLIIGASTSVADVDDLTQLVRTTCTGTEKFETRRFLHENQELKAIVKCWCPSDWRGKAFNSQGHLIEEVSLNSAENKGSKSVFEYLDDIPGPDVEKKYGLDGKFLASQKLSYGHNCSDVEKTWLGAACAQYRWDFSRSYEKSFNLTSGEYFNWCKTGVGGVGLRMYIHNSDKEPPIDVDSACQCAAKILVEQESQGKVFWDRDQSVNPTHPVEKVGAILVFSNRAECLCANVKGDGKLPNCQ